MYKEYNMTQQYSNRKDNSFFSDYDVLEKKKEKDKKEKQNIINAIENSLAEARIEERKKYVYSVIHNALVEFPGIMSQLDYEAIPVRKFVRERYKFFGGGRKLIYRNLGCVAYLIGKREKTYVYYLSDGRIALSHSDFNGYTIDSLAYVIDEAYIDSYMIKTVEDYRPEYRDIIYKDDLTIKSIVKEYFKDFMIEQKLSYLSLVSPDEFAMYFDDSDPLCLHYSGIRLDDDYD